MHLFVVIVVFDKSALDVLPQLTLVVVFVPGSNGVVKLGFEDESTSKDGTNKQRVSAEELVKQRLELVQIQQGRLRLRGMIV